MTFFIYSALGMTVVLRHNVQKMQHLNFNRYFSYCTILNVELYTSLQLLPQ